MKNLFQEVNTEEFLKRFKIRYPKSLFEPTPAEIHNSLKERRCIYCSRKLKIDIKGNGRCVSKFRDRYFVKAITLKKYEKFERENK